MMTRIANFAVLLLTFSSYWAGVDSAVVVGQTFLADTLDPRTGSTPWSLISHGIAEKLFTVSQTDDIVPQVGESVNKVKDDGTVWDVTVKSGYKFSDGTDVDATHVAACLNELNQKNDGAQASLGNMTVTAESSLTVRIESDRPTHVMDAVLAEWAFVIYYIDGDGNFIYTGPYVAEEIEAGSHILLVPNEYYPQADERPDISLQKYADGDALADATKDGKLDVGFHLPIHTLTELRAIDGVNIKTFKVGYHYMMFHNVREGSPTSDVNVRKAIDLVIDRNALSQALAGGKATRSLFPDFSPYFMDDSDPHGDEDEAAALLDAAGWVLSDGKRQKDGDDLELKLVAYPHRPGLVIMQPVIAGQLESLGITVKQVLTGQDWDETATIIENADFDLLMWAQHTLPAGDPAWFLNAFFRSDGGNNHPGFSSTTVDSLLDDLALKEDHDERVTATDSVHTTIVANVPVSNLVTPAWHVSLSDRVEEEYEPWGSDYYIIRADTFLGLQETSGTTAVALMSSLVLLATVTMALL